MTTTPLAAIADALIEFILGLLRDPAAAADFAANPDAALDRAGLTGVCANDVRSVMPVVVDNPTVIERPIIVHPPTTPPPHSHHDPEVIKQITTLTTSYHIDARSTIVDQSVNQSIWTEGGDVTQLFDQDAVIATGDGAIASGDDSQLDNSQTDVEVGDIAIGNTDTDVTIDGSFIDESTSTDTTVDADADNSFNETTTNTDLAVDDSFNDDVEVSDSSHVVVDTAENDEVDTPVSAVTVIADEPTDYEADDPDSEALADPAFDES